MLSQSPKSSAELLQALQFWIHLQRFPIQLFTHFLEDTVLAGTCLSILASFAILLIIRHVTNFNLTILCFLSWPNFAMLNSPVAQPGPLN